MRGFVYCSMLLALLCAVTAVAQDRAVVAVHTNVPDAVVFVDSVRMGPAYWHTFVVRPGRRTLRLVAPSETAWSIAPLAQRITATRGDTTVVALDFPFYHRIETIPPNAVVFFDAGAHRDMLGTTPLTHSAKERTGSFVLELPGYRAERLTPRTDLWNRYVLRLEHADQSETPQLRHANQAGGGSYWIEVAAAALVVAGGVLAVHHKFKADRLDDHYQATGNPDLRPRIARLDDRAAIALAGMHMGLLTLGVRFYLRR